jgi:heterodisulfide reductase subunit D
MQQLVTTYDIHACQDCGKCSSACPLALIGKSFSPRAIASAVITGGIHAPGVQENAWSCLTCGLCYDRCPSAVNFPFLYQGFASSLPPDRTTRPRGARRLLPFADALPHFAGGQPQRWTGLPEDIRTDPHSTTLFFGGCAPYYDIFLQQAQ